MCLPWVLTFPPAEYAVRRCIDQLFDSSAPSIHPRFYVCTQTSTPHTPSPGPVHTLVTQSEQAPAAFAKVGDRRTALMPRVLLAGFPRLSITAQTPRDRPLPALAKMFLTGVLGRVQRRALCRCLYCSTAVQR